MTLSAAASREMFSHNLDSSEFGIAVQNIKQKCCSFVDKKGKKGWTAALLQVFYMFLSLCCTVLYVITVMNLFPG